MLTNLFAQLVIVVLANWRIAKMLSDDTELGPGNILLKLRIWLGVEYDEFSMVRGTNILSEMILCIKCVSVWIGLFSTIAFLLNSHLTAALLMPFALSGLVILIDEH